MTDTVSIYKQGRAGSQESRSNTASYTNINAGISPTGDHIQTSEGGVASYQLFQIFIYDITVQIGIGDKIVSNTGTTYLITGSPNMYNNRFVQAISALGYVVT